MALRLHVLAGELYNTERYRVHGWLRVRGEEQEMHLELTGNCSADLAGWHIRFHDCEYQEEDDVDLDNETPGVESIPEEVEPTAADDASPDLQEYPFTAPEGPWVNPQVGPTGMMTVRRVKVPDCPIDEFYLRSKNNEPVSCTWKRCLYLEWHSQQGRVVVELIDPVLEMVEFNDITATPAATSVSPPLEQISETSTAAADDDGSTAAAELADDADLEDLAEDGYGLFPESLQEELDAQAAAVDRALRDSADDEDKPRCIKEMELMDDCIENEPGVPISALLEKTLRLPKPDQATEEEAERALKAVLAQLALFNISLSICKHFSARDAYRLLIEEICPEQRAYKQMRNTSWIQGFMTSESCPACDAEFEQEYAERERQRRENCEADPPPEDLGDEELPF